MTPPHDAESFQDLRASLGDPQLDPELLELALTHRSYAYENGGLPTNERLEFLGDSVLGVVITETLYRTHPDLSEGRLAKLRAAVVNARALAEVARTIGLGPYIRLGKGEESTGGHDKSSILADTVEALIGATYLSGGPDGAFDNARGLVHLLFDPLLEAAAALGAGLDWKTSLQEFCAEHDLGVPQYVIEDEGPDHMKTFTAQVRVAERLHGHGVGRSKKEAEQQAAEVGVRDPRRGAPCAGRGRRLRPRCLSSPRSRSSAVAWRPTCSAGRWRPSRCCTRAPYAGTCPAPRTSRPG